MTSKQRVKNSLNHKQPDMVPMDFGGTNVSGMHITCVAALRDYYGLEKRPVKVHEPFQMLGLIEEDLKTVLGVDVEAGNGSGTFFGFPAEDWKPWTLNNGLEVLVPGQFNTTKDSLGNTFIYPEGDTSIPPSGRMPKTGHFFDAIIRQEEINEDSLNAEDNLEEFKEITDNEISFYKRTLKAASETNRAVLASFGGTGLGDIALVPGTSLKHPKGIRDVEEWYISTAIRKDLLHEIYEKQTEIALKNLKRLHQEVGQYVDAAFICGTDFGTQTGTFCSSATFLELYKPYYRKVNDWIHENTTWKTFKHCCGAVEPFMKLFIDSGFDIINPVQCSATGMDPAQLKKKYGNDLTFWGGGVDTQQVLPFGSPKEVREQVLERCEIFSKQGGFVFGAIHNVQAMTPVENIVAMINAVHEFNGAG